MAIKQIDQQKCIGCGQCAKSCPADVIRFNTEIKKAEIKYPQECVLCLWCTSLCPKDAIVLTEDKAVPMFTCW